MFLEAKMDVALLSFLHKRIWELVFTKRKVNATSIHLLLMISKWLLIMINNWLSGMYWSSVYIQHTRRRLVCTWNYMNTIMNWRLAKPWSCYSSNFRKLEKQFLSSNILAIKKLFAYGSNFPIWRMTPELEKQVLSLEQKAQWISQRPILLPAAIAYQCHPTVWASSVPPPQRLQIHGDEDGNVKMGLPTSTYWEANDDGRWHAKCRPQGR